MKNRKNTIAPLLGLLLVAVATAMATWKNPTPVARTTNTQSSSKRPQVDRSQFPIADYNASEPTDEKERSRRRGRGKKYDQSTMEISPSDISSLTVRTHSESQLLPAKPITQSDAIVIGEVVDAKAFLSNDKTGVYSEFTIRTTDTIKNNTSSALPQECLIVATREGGQVKFSSGHSHVFFNAGERMPRVRQRYVFFLKRTDEERVFSLLTAYELKGGKVFPLDEHQQFKEYRNTDETTFLNELRGSLTNSSQVSPN